MSIIVLYFFFFLAVFFYFLVVFFFFKQKTPYEMRISDLSSDVCSSDLEGVHVDLPPGSTPGRTGRAVGRAIGRTRGRARHLPCSTSLGGHDDSFSSRSMADSAITVPGRNTAAAPICLRVSTSSGGMTPPITIMMSGRPRSARACFNAGSRVRWPAASEEEIGRAAWRERVCKEG